MHYLLSTDILIFRLIVSIFFFWRLLFFFSLYSCLVMSCEVTLKLFPSIFSSFFFFFLMHIFFFAPATGLFFIFSLFFFFICIVAGQELKTYQFIRCSLFLNCFSSFPLTSLYLLVFFYFHFFFSCRISKPKDNLLFFA